MIPIMSGYWSECSCQAGERSTRRLGFARSGERSQIIQRMQGNLAWQRQPVFASMPGLEELEEFHVEIRGITTAIRPPVPFLAEVHIVRVDIDEGHSTMLGNPIELALPDLDRRLLHVEKQRRILWKRVRKLNIAAAGFGEN